MSTLRGSLLEAGRSGLLNGVGLCLRVVMGAVEGDGVGMSDG
ncbi:MAG: hypothetical protein P8R54_15225 [Myxococcota bacterium]|nr:hypothetical protein [Myxococcota bacterium]